VTQVQVDVRELVEQEVLLLLYHQQLTLVEAEVAVAILALTRVQQVDLVEVVLEVLQILLDVELEAVLTLVVVAVVLVDRVVLQQPEKVVTVVQESLS
tara:strand:- start:42 stop:335 length:294 start_codon:yes stop_codon:yes gene_type:complete